MTEKVDNDRITLVVHVSCPILQISHHITTFSYLLSNSIIYLDFGNMLVLVNMASRYTLFLSDSVPCQFSMPLPHLTAEDSLSHYRGEQVTS